MDPGVALIKRVIGTEQSTTIGGRILPLNNCSFSWKVRYDEIIYVLSGKLQIIADRSSIKMEGSH